MLPRLTGCVLLLASWASAAEAAWQGAAPGLPATGRAKLRRRDGALPRPADLGW